MGRLPGTGNRGAETSGVASSRTRELEWFRPFYFVDYFYYRTVTSIFSRVRVEVTVPNRME